MPLSYARRAQVASQTNGELSMHLMILAVLLAGAPGMSSDIPAEHDILRASHLELEPVPEPEHEHHVPHAEPASASRPGPGGGGEIAELAAVTGLSEDRVAAFLALADCESGEWLAGSAGFVEGSANWSISHGTFEGGLQFHPGTWDAFRDAGHPDSAAQASRSVEIVVADRVRAAQGWRAWPVCSRKVGLR